MHVQWILWVVAHLHSFSSVYLWPLSSLTSAQPISVLHMGARVIRSRTVTSIPYVNPYGMAHSDKNVWYNQGMQILQYISSNKCSSKVNVKDKSVKMMTSALKKTTPNFDGSLVWCGYRNWQSGAIRVFCNVCSANYNFGFAAAAFLGLWSGQLDICNWGFLFWLHLCFQYFQLSF